MAFCALALLRDLFNLYLTIAVDGRYWYLLIIHLGSTFCGAILLCAKEDEEPEEIEVTEVNP